MAGGPTSDGLGYLAGLMTTGEQPVNSYWIALIPETEPGFTSDGETIIEPAFDDYGRAEILNESSAWSILEYTLTNAYDVEFPTAATEWGTVRYWAVCDQEVGGRVFFVGEMFEPIFVGVGGTVTLEPGTIALGFEGNQWKLGM